MNMFNQYIQYQNRFSSGQGKSSTQCSSRKTSDSEEPKKIVTVYDSLSLLPFDKKLAEDYQLYGPNLMKVCIYNAQVALRHGHRKIAECWRIVANCCRDSRPTSRLCLPDNRKALERCPNVSGEFHMTSKNKKKLALFRSWARHPDAVKLLNQVIIKRTNNDFQTAAMICSVFAKATNKNVHIDGGTFFSAFVGAPPRLSHDVLPHSVEAIVRRNKEIIHTETNPKVAAIAARQLRRAQRFKGLRNLSECQSESQDRRSIKEYHKESDSVASDGDNKGLGLGGVRHQGFGDRIASSVANTNLLNIPGILLNLTSSKSPTRKSTRSVSVVGLNRSYSEANVNENVAQLKDISDYENVSEDEEDVDKSSFETPLLDPSHSHIYDQFRSTYAEMLHRCGLAERAVEIMHLVENQESVDAESFIMYKAPENYKCPKCHNQDSQKKNLGNICKKCRLRTDPKCVYCRLPVKGHVSACLACGHGGHLIHMMEWFQNNRTCAAACGCNCLKEMEEFNYTPAGGGYLHK